MKYVRQFPKIMIYGIVLLFAVSEGYLLFFALETGKRKTLDIVILIPLFILMIALLPRMRIQTIVSFLLLIFWVPAGFDNWVLYLFEILLYGIIVLLMLQYVSSKSAEIKPSLINVPWFPFVFYILGALVTWSLSVKIGGELNVIRAMCVIPLALFIVFSLTIRSVEDGDRFLLIILTSAAVLGLLFLVGKKFSGFISLTNYAADSGRLSMRLSIPYVGSLEMLPQSSANWFGYLLVFAYSIWIFHPSTLQRTYAVFLCLLFGYVIITSQGRGGALTAALGVGIISVYATLTRRLFDIKGIWIKFLFVCLAIVGGFWYMAVHSANSSFYQHGVSLFVNPQSDPTLLVRFQGWANGLKLFLAHPIFGIGISGIQTPWGPDTSEILNYFFLNLLSYGLLGFLGIMLILYRLVAAFWKGIQSGNRVTRMMAIASICGMLGFFLGMQPEEPFSTIIVWAPLLIAFTVSQLEGNQLVRDPNSLNALN